MRIISDGTSTGTMLFDKNGYLIKNIQEITYHISASGKCSLTIVSDDIEVEINLKNELPSI